MIWIILYFLIGIILGLTYYAWECYKYKKKYENRFWKLTWDEYSIEEEEVGVFCVIVIILWPVCILSVLLYIACSILGKYIRKYFGIE